MPSRFQHDDANAARTFVSQPQPRAQLSCLLFCCAPPSFLSEGDGDGGMHSPPALFIGETDALEVAALLDGRRKRCRVRPGGALEIDVALRLGGGACGLSPSLASSRCGAAGVGASPATLRALPKEGLSDNEDESAQLVADAQAAADADDADGHARRDAPRGGPVAVEMTTWKQAEQ